MNVGSDIAQLSYKELQALALRYRVPGNIKVSCHRPCRRCRCRCRRRDEDVPTIVSFPRPLLISFVAHFYPERDLFELPSKIAPRSIGGCNPRGSVASLESRELTVAR